MEYWIDFMFLKLSICLYHLSLFEIFEMEMEIEVIKGKENQSMLFSELTIRS